MKNPSVSLSRVERIIKALEGMKYGSVLITVHDEQIVQIERTEKLRFSQTALPERRSGPHK